MLRIVLVAWLVVQLFFAGACGPNTVRNDRSAVESYIPDSGSVGFDISPLPIENGTTRWLATYNSQGKVAKFRIEFGPAKYSETKEPHDSRIGVGEGRILAETGSENSVLLADLKKALEAKEFPKKVQRVTSLPFTFANLGDRMSQARGGGFNATPRGNWTATKIFFGEGEQESEVFLNIDPIGQKGQFSIKDAEYGDMVIAQLAKVL